MESVYEQIIKDTMAEGILEQIAKLLKQLVEENGLKDLEVTYRDTRGIVDFSVDGYATVWGQMDGKRPVCIQPNLDGGKFLGFMEKVRNAEKQ